MPSTAAPPLRWFEPPADAVAGAVILRAGDGAPIAEALARAGFRCVVPDLLARWDGDPERACDGHALLDVEAAREALAARAGRVFAVGAGRGGTWAMMALSALCGFAGAVAFQPRVAYPSLCEQRPTQPLDLLPGVRAPLQVHFAEIDPLVPAHHVEAFRDRLERLPSAGQVFVYPGTRRGFLDPSDPDWHEASARMALSRASRFLERIAVQ